MLVYEPGTAARANPKAGEQTQGVANFEDPTRLRILSGNDVKSFGDLVGRLRLAGRSDAYLCLHRGDDQMQYNSP